MFGWFGKRARETQDDSVRQIIPQELWEGEIGQALRDAGMAPDDAANLVPVHPVDARIAAEKLAHEEKLAGRNAQLAVEHPGCSVATQFILTDDVWNGRHAELLLYVLELTPYWQFNTRLLPADEASARAMGLPVHHLGQFGDILKVADGHIAELAEKCGLGDVAKAYAASDDAKNALRRELAGLTNYYYEECILPLLGENPYPAGD
jgi:hypothetical protein